MCYVIAHEATNIILVYISLKEKCYALLHLVLILILTLCIIIALKTPLWLYGVTPSTLEYSIKFSSMFTHIVNYYSHCIYAIMT
jgi:hypothetical protein